MKLTLPGNCRKAENEIQSPDNRAIYQVGGLFKDFNALHRGHSEQMFQMPP
jgi:hypothetical protein